ncbi:MAG TPA: tetratricopeptide repeat protein, partial [Gaiellaceae bacterium]|nr:tetratricopeptide repeat protein [Gaiellaceae bacterium]
PPSLRERRIALALVAPLVVVALAGAGAERHTYWRAALHQAQSAPLGGDGAGSFARHWLATRDVPFDVHDAHSLYLETLGELGLVGLVLLLLAFAPPLRFAPRAPAAAGALVVVLVHAAYDWDWEMPAVTLAAVFCAIALARRGDGTIGIPTWAAAVPVAVATLALVPFVGHAALAGADAAFRESRVAEATERIDRAETFLPWSHEPWFLEARVLRQRGADASALDALREALERDASDARVWRALAELTSGEERARALERAKRLDPLGAPER